MEGLFSHREFNSDVVKRITLYFSVRIANFPIRATFQIFEVGLFGVFFYSEFVIHTICEEFRVHIWALLTGSSPIIVSPRIFEWSSTIRPPTHGPRAELRGRAGAEVRPPGGGPAARPVLERPRQARPPPRVCLWVKDGAALLGARGD